MFKDFINSLMTKGTLRAFRHRNFVIVEAAGWLTGAGVWFYRIGIQVLAWELTGSGLWLGLIALAEAGPGIFIAPIAGALADRHDRLVLARRLHPGTREVTARSRSRSACRELSSAQPSWPCFLRARTDFQCSNRSRFPVELPSPWIALRLLSL